MQLAGLAPGALSPRERHATIATEATQAAHVQQGWHERDSYAQWVEFWHGWPVANERLGIGRTSSAKRRQMARPRPSRT